MQFLATWGLYGTRPVTHFDFYQQATGWWFLEVASLTIEAHACTCGCAPRLRRVLRYSALALVILAVDYIDLIPD